MNKTQEALRMAIEVMEEGFGTLECEGMLPHRYQEAIKTCKEALAELEQTKQLGVVYNGNAYWVGEAPDNGTPLYTSPQCLQEQLKRLTDDEIEDIGCRYADLGGDISDWEGFANAIQDKLGVKQNETQTL